ncbi:MAG: hypothetical protein RE471_08210 [Ferroplasma sp.]|uniref:hypothetical protein n=1 Tax=Ferroplasma sp. TaxID=2591003 RepID=UPI0028169BF9|nr:hypothetical protein [Ferroplasma sp.]WMT50950.1 MAG: hypothetical protein RE471_08210 [Ferroplasma sp.]
MNNKNKIFIFIFELVLGEFVALLGILDFLTLYNVQHKIFSLYFTIIFLVFAILLPVITIIYWRRGIFKKYLN